MRDVTPFSTEVDQDGDNYVICTVDGGGWDGDPSILGGGDCNSGDGNVNPGVTEETYNGLDDDCNPATLDYSWKIDTPDSTGIVGQYTSIALDSSGNVHISYIDWSNYDLKYATNSGVTPGDGNCSGSSAFNCTTVDSTGNVG